ncbi:hypothetical protein ABZY81_40710 [Streptomyces sp. NPDC006514]|uniref:hypothetical protein n=1 Tax=Streptomyces sp. NPDC006514 TaxID=3154308 RepID=UPI0033B9A7D7
MLELAEPAAGITKVLKGLGVNAIVLKAGDDLVHVAEGLLARLGHGALALLGGDQADVVGAADGGVQGDEGVVLLVGELTRISTVLRYPPPPRWRRDPRTDSPLRLRLPAGLPDRARAVSLHLPGQYPRAHRDYQSRALTDAVMTAIAVAEPFTDDVLDGLLPLLRHRAAHNLWRLASVALCTRPEFRLLHASEDVRDRMEVDPQARLDDEEQRLLDVVEALEEDVAWHSPARFVVAANIARDRLRGARAESRAHVLRGRSRLAPPVQDTLNAREEECQALLEGTTDYDWSGRGGTAVWRAERRVSFQHFKDWLVGSTEKTPAQMMVAPPGWMVVRPTAWEVALPVPTMNGRLPDPFPQWVSEGRALAFPYRNMQALWPLRRSQGSPDWEPVPGVEHLLATARVLPAEKVLGYIEAVLIEWKPVLGRSQLLSLHVLDEQSAHRRIP